ncbi:MAG: hypothetical protein MJY91_09610 [Bacteroidales bacterium]|nr:hypothetical protein [Bacteroidales bacterium]
MKKYIYSIMAVAAVLASCTKVKTDSTTSGALNSEDSTASITTINVSTNTASKAYVSAEDNTRVLWEDGDNICAFCYGKASNGNYGDFPVRFSLYEGAGQESGTFKMVEDPKISLVTRIYSIVYPETAFVTLLGSYAGYDRLVLNIPTVQKARKGSFDKDAAIMYDISYAGNIDDLHLKYAVNFLKITLTESVNSVIIEADEPLSGKIEISNNVISPYYEGTANHVELKAEDGGLIEPGVYYIAVRPCDIHNPTVTFRTPHSIKIKKSKGTLSFAAGKNVKPISVDWTKGDVTSAVQLWAGGPFWSIKNIGAANEYDPGYYFSWGNTTGYVYDSTLSKWKVAPGYPNAGTIWDGGFNWSHYYGSHGQSLQRDLQANASDDAAVAAWGSDWRMPTKSEVDGFNGNVTPTLSSDGKYIKVNGQEDYINDYIILPIGGSGFEDTNGETHAHWSWTSTYFQRKEDNNKVYSLLAARKNPNPHSATSANGMYGMNIRPVYVAPNL